MEWGKFREHSILKNSRWDQTNFFHGFFTRSIDGNLESKDWKKNFPDIELYQLKQVHGTNLIDTRENFKHTPEAETPPEAVSLLEARTPPEADGWLIDVSSNKFENKLFSVITADCVPAILYSKQTNLAAILHLGWRSVEAGLLEKATQAIGGSASSVELLMGPSAGACCYEFDESLASQLEEREENKNISKTMFDLKGLIRTKALKLGLNKANIQTAKECTICNKKFFSYRRENTQAGRQLTVFGKLKN